MNFLITYGMLYKQMKRAKTTALSTLAQQNGLEETLQKMKTHMQFDNHDDRIRYYELLPERDLDALPRFPLPEGYRFVFFRQGDRDNWIDIELSAKELMRALGYTHAKIPTQTTTWLACRIYLDFGFRPLPQNAINNRAGWRIIRALTNHAALELFEPSDMDEIIAEGGKETG